ncbi:hypothetical protein L4X63_21665 [Geomonas sp. Red32]|uniref:hypothetical protein n=1 Tax=Geomonas sp. Red32 TaxID=2912856 RepID=UPI00202CC4B9|nr:hypothetical protein [Geomonas sp. Red32]MCM0084195.1 hypothetical protein [Geomonas sp. Red32]
MGKKATISLGLLLAGTAVCTFAAVGLQIQGVPAGVGFTASNGVTLNYSGTDGHDYYSIGTKHREGEKYFVTTSGMDAVYYQQMGSGIVPQTGDTPAIDVIDPSLGATVTASGKVYYKR